MSAILVISVLLVLPIIASRQQGVDLRWAGIYAVFMSALTYWVYAKDKRRAEEGEWRIPEAHLHLLELIGGWPGAFLAQRRLRHKCTKRSYLAVFWMIVLLHQVVAFDSLQNWRFLNAVVNLLEHASKHRR